MSWRIFVLLLLCLPAMLTACGDDNVIYQPVPGTDNCFYSIYREDVQVAVANISPVDFPGSEKWAQPVQERLALLWQQRHEQQIAQAEQEIANREFNGSLPPWQLCYSSEECPISFFADKQVVSITVEGSEYTLGEAHPFSYRYAYNLDAVSGQMLSLENIWGGNAREKAAAEIFAQIEKASRIEDFYPGLADNLLAYLGESNWHMDDKNIYVFYNPYEIGPYALGVVEFELPK